MKCFVYSTAVAAVLAVTPAAPHAQSKSSATAGCTASIDDALDNRIRSDSRGPYRNSTDGVRCEISTSQQEGVFPTIVLDLTRSRARAMVFDYSASTGTLMDNAKLAVRTQLGLGTGERVTTVARFYTDVGLFRFDAAYPPATHVALTRIDATTWRLTGPVYPELSTLCGDDLQTAETDVRCAGNGAVLLKQSGGSYSELAGHYRMPFSITFTCPTCTQ